MTFLGFTISRSHAENPGQKWTQDHCKAVGDAVGKGDIGKTVTAIQGLILRYYDDVRGQAGESFKSAKRVALFGFILLVATILYVMFIDLMRHFSVHFIDKAGGIGVGTVGLIASSVVELISGVQFVLYGRATKQFGAFHICLERTHRYLLAYEMTEQIKTTKDKTLEEIVCIMASAPMITQADIEGVGSGNVVRPTDSAQGSPAVTSSQSKDNMSITDQDTR
jgi:hypothetical protein